MFPFFSAIFLLFSFLEPETICKEDVKRRNTLLEQEISSHIIKEKAEKGLSCVAKSLLAKEEVTEVMLAYEAENSLNISEARKLFVALVEDFVELVNTNKELATYFVERPFNYTQVNIHLSFKEAVAKSNETLEGEERVAPFVFLAEKYVCYATLHPETKEVLIFFLEPYQEALKITQK